MRPGRALFVLAGLALSIGCDGGGSVSTAPPPGPIAQDLASLAQAPPLIIVGKVEAIRPGRTAGEGEARLQFNDVQITVEKTLKGEPPIPLVVEQVAIAGRVLSPEVGPPYQRGERYVLFLRPGEPTRYITIPQGRYQLKGGTVHTAEVGPVADKMKGMAEAKFIEEILATLRGRR